MSAIGEDALVNRFDDVEPKVPVHISDLPVEIFQHIFKLLPEEDLDNCLDVNLQWRNNANDNTIWKACCSKYGVEDEGDKAELAGDQYEDLCRPARIWFAFRDSPAYKWRTNSPTQYEIEYNYLYEYSYESVIFLSDRINYVESLVKISEPKTIYNLNPALEIDRYEFMGNKYAMFYCKKVLMIYEFEEGIDLNFYFAIGFNNYIPYVIDCFDEHKFSKSESGLEYPICDIFIDYLGKKFLFEVNIIDDQIRQYWIDCCKKIITPMVDNEGSVLQLTKNHMILDSLNFMDHEIKICDNEGLNPKNITGLFSHCKANNNVFLGLTPEGVMESWDMKTCNRLKSFPNIEFNNFHESFLHPSLEIVYLTQEGKGVKAINLRIGETIWENNDIDNIEELELVCGKYLVEKSIIGNPNHFINVWDIRDGRFLYKRQLPNIPCIRDNFILLNDPDETMLLSYSHMLFY